MDSFINLHYLTLIVSRLFVGVTPTPWQKFGVLRMRHCVALGDILELLEPIRVLFICLNPQEGFGVLERPL